jgi:hypothetical protein
MKLALLINILVDFAKMLLLGHDKIEEVAKNGRRCWSFDFMTEPEAQLVLEVQANEQNNGCDVKLNHFGDELKNDMKMKKIVVKKIDNFWMVLKH